MTVRIGTRASNLAMWQAKTVSAALEASGVATELVPLTSTGDRSLGGQLSSSVGQFIHSIDNRLLSGEIDIAVHSSKDVPVDVDDRITNLAYLERGCTTDFVLMRKTPDVPVLEEVLTTATSTPLATVLERFDRGATFGTVSGRRQSFLLSQRPDIIPLAVRGHVETRIARLMQGRVDAIVLAETGLARLNSIGVLDDVKADISAFRIDPNDWPTAPGQGAIAVHCLSNRLDELNGLRTTLNHEQTERDVSAERRLLAEVGGGCLFPAGIGVEGDEVRVQVSPENWRSIFCQGTAYTMFHHAGAMADLDINLPVQPLEEVSFEEGRPRYLSTLNSDRISLVLSKNGVNMENIPVVDLVPLLEKWPANFLNAYEGKASWPYLVLTSPFAAKCAVKAAASNADIGRIPWLAIGEGTARACFRLGVTVSACARARNAKELAAYICDRFETSTGFLIPRSNQASPQLETTLRAAGFAVESWLGYENSPKQMPSVEVRPDDVLVLSSSSSARSWAENRLKAPHEILCMGENARDTIHSLDHFSGCRVSVLSGPTSEALITWWKENRGE
ncbi:MAG: hydroxymethylbilane synthase [Poseidonia sp.]